jgi:hypothetical protein
MHRWYEDGWRCERDLCHYPIWPMRVPAVVSQKCGSGHRHSELSGIDFAHGRLASRHQSWCVPYERFREQPLVACSHLSLTWEGVDFCGDFPRDKEGSPQRPWSEAMDGIFGTHTVGSLGKDSSV